MTVAGLLRARRAARDRAETAAADAALCDAARSFRRRAQQQVAAGHPELARPYLDEAEMFEAVVQRAPSL